MSNGEEIEKLQESQEALEKEEEVVTCVQIDINERTVKNDEPSSCGTTPLEMSEEGEKPLEGKVPPVLKEWSSSINLLARIPVRAQKGLSTFDLKLTCVGTINQDILVIGTNVGVVYWYNRKTDVLDRLRCEGLEPVTSISCIGTVDYMVAAGNQSGIVTIFQVPRESHQDSSKTKGNANSAEIYYERKTKKSQRFLVQDLHKGAVTSLEWSRNGMKLFSGDQTGHVVLTDIDYDLVQIRSSVLLCEHHEIVQLSYARKHLLICSTFQSIIYSLENKSFSKVGTQDRKTSDKLGGLIVSSAWEESPNIFCARPGARLWLAYLSGAVKHTIKFKEPILSNPESIHLVKPHPHEMSPQDIKFSRLLRFMNDYLVTFHKDVLYVVDPLSTQVVGVCIELRGILDVAVNKDEIFVLEAPRNLVRLSVSPDPCANLSATNFFANFTTSGVGGSDGGKTLPDIMSASIADFRFPQESFSFLTSKIRETSDKVIPKINPILNTIKTVIEADVDIEDGQKLLETGIPEPFEFTADVAGLDVFTYPIPVPLEQPVYVPEPERFQKLTQLPFEDVLVEIKCKRGKKVGKKLDKKSEDSVSVSSAFSNTSGSECTTDRKQDTTPSSSGTSCSGSEPGMSSSEHPYLKASSFGNLPMSQSWSAGTFKQVTTEELHLKEELLARQLKWPELLPESVHNDILEEDTRAPSCLTLVREAHSEDDTDSRTLSLENGSLGTVKDMKKDASSSEEEEDDVDFYARYRSKDSYSVSSLNSVLSFGPPSGSSHLSTGAAALRPLPHQDLPPPPQEHEEELTSSKETTATSSEEAESIVESKIILDDHWRRWRLPETASQISHLSLCDHYIVGVSVKGIVYYAAVGGVTLSWKKARYLASYLAVSWCGQVVWRIQNGDIYTLTNLGNDGPTSDTSEQWSRLTRKRDVVQVSVTRQFGWVVKADGSLEFSTGHLDSRFIPYFERVYAPWPLQEVVVTAGHKLWGLTTDGRLVFRTGTSHHNPKGVDWLEIRWTGVNQVPSQICGISGGEQHTAGNTSTIWFTDCQQNLYFTTDERDSKGNWIPWKVSVSTVPPAPVSSTTPSKLSVLNNIRDQVSTKYQSLKSLVLPGQNLGLKVCTSKSSMFYCGNEDSFLFGNRSTVTGHSWRPLKIDQGFMVPSTWTSIYANSIYKGHGFLWVADNKGGLFYLPPEGGRVHRLEQPMFTDGSILCIAPAPEALWVLTSSGDVYGRCGITQKNPIGTGWRQMTMATLESTQFVDIACGSEVAWAVDEKGDVFMRVGSLVPPGHQDMSPAWNKVESSVNFGKFTKIYVGSNDSMVWAVDSQKRVYVRQAVFPDYPIGTGWLMVKGVEAEMLSISDTGVWALSSNGNIYRRHGISKTNFVGDYWRKIPGTEGYIAVSLCDELWALTGDGYLLKHSKKQMELTGWGDRATATVSSPGGKLELDEEDEDWELVDNSEISKI